MNMTDYEATRRSFRLQVPADFEYARDVVGGWAARQPGKVALVAVGPDGATRREITFSDLARGSNRFANALAGLGVAAGEMALVMLPRIPEWHEALLGLFRAGVVALPGTMLLTARDVEHRLVASEAALAIVDEEGAQKVLAVRDRCPSLRHLIVVGGRPDAGTLEYAQLLARASDREPPARPTSKDDPLLVYFTSGTVAEPKTVLHTHASYGAGHEVTARFWQDLTPDDLHWTVSDTGWAKAAWGMIFGQWIVGARVFVWDQRGRLDPDQLLRVLASHGVTTFCAPPTLYRALVQQDLGAHDLSRVRHAVAAGEPLNPEVIRHFRETVELPIGDGYGQTETGAITGMRPDDDDPGKDGSMGRPLPGIETRVHDGELHVKPETVPSFFSGFLGEEPFAGEWWQTGDEVREDEDGYLWFEGRDDDIILTAGYRVGPFEVESALVSHPAVAEAAAVASPDEERGSVVKAFVVLRDGEPSDRLAAELQEHVKRVTAPYKYPRIVEFAANLPQTPSGKIKRAELRAR